MDHLEVGRVYHVEFFDCCVHGSFRARFEGCRNGELSWSNGVKFCPLRPGHTAFLVVRPEAGGDAQSVTFAESDSRPILTPVGAAFV